MAKKLNISKANLQSIKNAVKTNKISSNENNENKPSLESQMRAAKAAARNECLIENGVLPQDLEKNFLRQKNEARKEFTSSQEIKTTYGFDVGSLVSFNYNKKEEIGIIYNIIENKKRNQETALDIDDIMVISSRGFLMISAKSINDILECI